MLYIATYADICECQIRVAFDTMGCGIKRQLVLLTFTR